SDTIVKDQNPKQPNNLADLLKPAKTSTASVKRFLGHQNNTVNTIPKITKKPRKQPFMPQKQ
ncbi:hypothetical protein, partial [Acetobacter indonesiensis]|uniref:hypothetical protein n=1 Tax=Acetobacter indonesiensis TaxID=104101 RepID=UPI0020A597A7